MSPEKIRANPESPEKLENERELIIKRLLSPSEQKKIEFATSEETLALIEGLRHDLTGPEAEKQFIKNELHPGKIPYVEYEAGGEFADKLYDAWEHERDGRLKDIDRLIELENKISGVQDEELAGVQGSKKAA